MVQRKIKAFTLYRLVVGAGLLGYLAWQYHTSSAVISLQTTTTSIFQQQLELHQVLLTFSSSPDQARNGSTSYQYSSRNGASTENRATTLTDQNMSLFSSEQERRPSAEKGKPAQKRKAPPRTVSRRYGRNPIPEPEPPKDGFWDAVTALRTTRQVPKILYRIRNMARSQHNDNHSNNDNANENPISVLLWPQALSGVQTPEHKLLLNGVSESPFLQLIDNWDDRSYWSINKNMIWIADSGWGWGWNRWCENLARAVKTHIVERYHQQQHNDQKTSTTTTTNNTTLQFSFSWPIFIVDFSDGHGRQRCLDVEALVGKNAVFYSARSVVRGRRFKEDLNWVTTGRRCKTPKEFSFLPNVPHKVRAEKSYRHTPITVRTDIVEQLQTVLRKRYGKALGYSVVSNDDELPRPIDVTHFWPLQFNSVNSAKMHSQGIRKKHASLRSRVSEVIHSFSTERGWNASIGIQGLGGAYGRLDVKASYVEALLETKIVVVTQRDSWEDHYRLMEALVSGACVFTDVMLALPSGLRNGTSIVMFQSPGDLKSLLTYYLTHTDERRSVAQAGRDIAFSQHRTWHRVEEIVFGTRLSKCRTLSNRATSNQCPYTVHAEGIAAT